MLSDVLTMPVSATASIPWPARTDKWPVVGRSDKWPRADKWPAAVGSATDTCQAAAVSAADKWPAAHADKWPRADKWPGAARTDKWPGTVRADKWPAHAPAWRPVRRGTTVGTFVTQPPLPMPIAGAGVGASSGNIYVVGGFTTGALQSLDTIRSGLFPLRWRADDASAC